jgi:hypothetical protein
VKLGSSRRRESQRRRQRVWLGLFKWVLLIGAVFLAGGYAWYTGSSVARREADQLQAENTAFKQDIEKLQAQIAEGKGREAGLAQQVPPENLRNLMELIRGKVNNGVPVERLEFVISAAMAERSCDAAPSTKRFFVQTPVHQTPGALASFGDNAITVTADGNPTVNPQGKLEAWFDPAQPVTLTFTEAKGAVSKTTGVLPIARSIVVGGFEYKFSIAAGVRGIVNVTLERCRYP